MRLSYSSTPMLLRRFVGLVASVCAVSVGTALAGDVDLSTFADRVDPIGCARAAHEAGDAKVLAQLGPGVARESQLVAVRAAPYVHAPEELLARLVELSCGRDPSLAPEAALSLHAIAASLAPSDLAAREVLLSDLVRAEERVAQGCEHAPIADVTFALEDAKLRLHVLRGQAAPDGEN